MKRYVSLVVLSLLSLTLLGVAGTQAAESSQNGLNLGARYHANHSVFTELPYDDGDISYLLGWEMEDEDGYIQLAVDYAPSVTGADPLTGIETTDYVITPQLNIGLVDNLIVGGIGILQSYISDDVTGEDWTDLYWQLRLGVRMPLGDSLKITIEAIYPFESWSDVGDLEGDDLDYGAFLTLCF